MRGRGRVKERKKESKKKALNYEVFSIRKEMNHNPIWHGGMGQDMNTR